MAMLKDMILMAGKSNLILTHHGEYSININYKLVCSTPW